MTFENDPFSRTLIRGLVLLQPTALAVVLKLSQLELAYLAMAISCLTLFLLLAIILSLYLRYRKIPIVRKKRKLQRLRKRFQKRIQTEGSTLRAAIKERKYLSRSEKEEINAALRVLQKNYIETGLANALIKAATIQGVEPELKERLAECGILSAEHVNAGFSQLQGFGEAKRQALIGWQSSVLTRLENSKPVSLPNEQLKTIKEKFQALLETNNTVERIAIANKERLEHEFTSLNPRLQQLTSITFMGYLSQSLVTRGMVAVLLAFLLIATQVLSSVSATGSAILSSISTEAPTSTVTQTPLASPLATQTFTPTISHTSKIAPATGMMSQPLTPQPTSSP
jgi:hypothetical protein